ncbi:MAG: response regulator [Bacteroidota bacterium]|nr:response regulator [Bacteroidota bacterium]
MINSDLNKILYVEDEPDIQEVVYMSLVDIGGFNVKICSSGEEAVKIVSDYNPDLFLLDIMMPEIDGPTVLKIFRNFPKFAKTPAIFITAKTQMSELLESKDQGVLGIIRKPFDPITISDTIKSLWNEYSFVQS